MKLYSYPRTGMDYDDDVVPAPREISDEMTQLPLNFDDDTHNSEASMDYPEGDLEEGVSLTQAMDIRRPAHNNMW